MIAQVIVKKKLKNEVLDYKIPEHLSVENFSLVRVPFRNTKAQAIVVGQKESSKFALKPIDKILSKGPLFTSLQYRLANTLKSDTLSNLNETMFAFLPLLNIKDLKVMGAKTKTIIHKPLKPTFYMGSWQERLEYFCQKSAGSQKQILFVLPTIDKIEQARKTIKRISSKSDIFTWHSKLPRAQKARIWQTILEGKACIIIGSRHSLFLPFVNLEYIFLDDPTNFAYHDDQAPYYNALSICKQVTIIAKCNLVVMSALCDLQSFANITKGKIDLDENKTKPKIVFKQSFDNLLRSPFFEKYLKQKVSKQKRVLIVGRYNEEKIPFCQDCQSTIPLSTQPRNLDSLICPNCSSAKIKLLGKSALDETKHIEANYPFLLNKIGLSASGRPVTVCDINDFYKLKPAFDTVIFADFDQIADTPYVGFRYKLFKLILDTRDLYISQVIICSNTTEQSDFIDQVKTSNWQVFLKDQLKERKKLSLPPFERAVTIKLKTSYSAKKETVFSELVENLKYFKPVSTIESQVKDDLLRIKVTGTVAHNKWSDFILDFKTKAPDGCHIEPDPVELS